jgi:hypothetical protein
MVLSAKKLDRVVFFFFFEVLSVKRLSIVVLMQIPSPSGPYSFKKKWNPQLIPPGVCIVEPYRTREKSKWRSTVTMELHRDQVLEPWSLLQVAIIY